jgi:hypothetical protein
MLNLKLPQPFKELCETRFLAILLTLTVTLLTVILPIYFGGLHGKGDLPTYLGFAREIREAIGFGHFFPGWAGDNGGYGSLGVRFYPPLSSYVIALISTLANNWYYTTCIYFCVWVIIGCWGCYLFVREWGTGIQALCAALLYGIAPFALAQIYQFSLYAEFAAGALVPYCFWFCTRVSSRRAWQDVIWFSISMSALILTHLPTPIFTCLLLLIYIPFVVDVKALWRTAFALAVSALLVVLATSFYTVRLVTELQWLAHGDEKYYTGFAGYQQWLFPTTMNPPDVPAVIHIYRTIDAMVFLSACLLIPSLICLIFRTRTRFRNYRIQLGLSCAAIFGIIILSRLGAPIWAEFTLLQRTQFPWRLLTVISPLAVLSFVFSVSNLWHGVTRIRPLLIAGMIATIFVIAVFDVRQNFQDSHVIPKDQFAEYLDFENYSTAVDFEEWWPVWARERALEIRAPVIAGDRNVEIFEWQAMQRRFAVSEGPPTSVRVATFYYPHWKASVNGVTALVEHDEDGVIRVPVGGGYSDVVLAFEEPPINIFALWVSAATWILMMLALLTHAGNSLLKTELKKRAEKLAT